jgi:superfamily II DNA or RNA helicase
VEIELRPYQKESVKRVLGSYAQNPRNRELLILPTGAGKTIIAAKIIEMLHRLHGLNTLFVAHRDELLSQAADKYRLIRPDAIIGKVGSGTHDYGGEVTVASIATISRPEHIKRLKTIGYGLIIVDECHHVASDGYQRVLDALPEAFVLMITATGDRLDGKPILDKPPIYQESIIDMIADGYLCDVKAIAIRTETNLDNLHTQMGDYNEHELAEAVDTDTRNSRVVDAYKEHATGRRAACFAVTVAHAQHLSAAFSSAGIPAGVVCGNTPLDERKRLFHRFHDGAIRVLCTVNVLSEGWDEPLCDCIIMARPTQSRSLYVQAVGRALRLAPGKDHAIILDLTDNCLKHRLEPQSLSKALGKQLQDGETIEEALAREAAASESEREKRVRKLKDIRHSDIVIDLKQKLVWQERADGKFVLEIGFEKHRIALVPSELYDGYYRVVAKLAPRYQGQYWSNDIPLGYAQELAEKKARLLLSDAKSIALVDRNARWRSDPATPVQLEKLAKYAYRFSLQYDPATVTKGEAADMLDAVYGTFEACRQQKEAKKIGA